MFSSNHQSFHTEDIVRLIELFRTFCTQDCLLIEQNRKSLISHHDKTIRFTNSTTSVLKPLLEESILAPGVFLIQPALGQQGRIAWQKDKILGPYASYFNSLGTLQPKESLKTAALSGYEFICKHLNVSPNRVAVQIYGEDNDLLQAFSNQSINIVVNNDPSKIFAYRHRYGIDNISGRNANYSIYDDNGIMKEVGNLTIIERESTPIAVEISYDTTTLLSNVMNLPHPIIALPASSVLVNKNVFDQKKIITEELVFIDSLNVSMALILHGLEPSSRGRGRNLRDFIAIACEYFKTNRISKSLAQEWASAVCRDERIVYQALSKCVDESKDIDDDLAGQMFIKAADNIIKNSNPHPEWK